jgi:uncharacterized protein YndB with AHSA1/START domain
MNSGLGDVSMRRLILVLACLVVPSAAFAQESWYAQDDVHRRLLEREIVVRSSLQGESAHGRVSAAVLIAAPPATIWNVMTDCAQALTFVPGLKVCRRLDGAADGTWDIIEHEVRYSWFLPTTHYVFRADYVRPHRIRFERVSGDLKEQEGEWVLEPLAAELGTIVVYELHLDPGFFIPQGVVRRALRKDVPALLAALRARVEQPPSVEPP